MLPDNGIQAIYNFLKASSGGLLPPIVDLAIDSLLICLKGQDLQNPIFDKNLFLI